MGEDAQYLCLDKVLLVTVLHTVLLEDYVLPYQRPDPASCHSALSHHKKAAATPRPAVGPVQVHHTHAESSTSSGTSRAHSTHPAATSKHPACAASRGAPQR